MTDFATRALILSKHSPHTNFGSPTSMFPAAYAPFPIDVTTKTMRNAIADLHQKTVIVDVDKSTHPVVAVCWKLYVAQVVHTLQNADDYSRVNMTVNQVHMLLKTKLSTILHPAHFSQFRATVLKVAASQIYVTEHASGVDSEHIFLTEVVLALTPHASPYSLATST